MLLDLSQRTSWLTQGHNARAIFGFCHSHVTHGQDCHQSPQDSTSSVVNFSLQYPTQHSTLIIQHATQQQATHYYRMDHRWHPVAPWSSWHLEWPAQPSLPPPPLSTRRWSIWVHLSISSLTSSFRKAITSASLIPNSVRGGSQSGVDSRSNGKWFFTVHVTKPVLQSFHTCFQLVMHWQSSSAGLHGFIKA